jgi:hypothetical protein
MTERKKPAAPPKSDSGAAINREFERFEDLTRKLLEVSKRELDEKRNGH